MYTLHFLKPKGNSIIEDSFVIQGQLFYDNRKECYFRNYDKTISTTLYQLTIPFLVKKSEVKKSDRFIYENEIWTRADNEVYINGYTRKESMLAIRNLDNYRKEIPIEDIHYKIYEEIKDNSFINCIILGTYKEGDEFEIKFIIDCKNIRNTDPSRKEYILVTKNKVEIK